MFNLISTSINTSNALEESYKEYLSSYLSSNYPNPNTNTIRMLKKAASSCQGIVPGPLGIEYIDSKGNKITSWISYEEYMLMHNWTREQNKRLAAFIMGVPYVPVNSTSNFIPNPNFNPNTNPNEQL